MMVAEEARPGRTASATPLTWYWSDAKVRWTNQDAAPERMVHHTATTLADEQVLVAGGYEGSSVLADAFIYTEENGWTVAASMNDARYSHTATLLNDGRVLVVGGYDGNGNPMLSAEIYDPRKGSWTYAGSNGQMADSRAQHAASLMSDGRVLITGGRAAGGVTDSVEIYDPQNDKFSPALSMPQTKHRHASTVVNSNLILVTGGDDGNSPVADSFLFDRATGRWDTVSSGMMTAARADHAATLIAGQKVLVTGGIDASGKDQETAEMFDLVGGWVAIPATMATGRSGHTATAFEAGWGVLVAGGRETASAEVFLTDAQEWSSVPDMDIARANHAAAALSTRRILLVGGDESGTIQADSEVFVVGDFWATTGNLASARALHTATVVQYGSSGSVLVAGGWNGSSLSTSERFLPAPGSGGWTSAETRTMSGPRFAHSATRLANGNVLLVGGQSGTAKSTTLKSAELFDMGWLNWRAAGNLMNRARRYHTATLLASGKVLIAAGENSLGAENTAEIYDPVIETWTMTGALTLPRYSHTATLLNDGRVLVSGGYEDGFLPTAHVEIYDPASGAWSEAAPMLAKRVFHSASLLPDGRVLIAGGYDGWQTRSDAEIYDPTIQPDNSLGATSQVGPMSAPRDSHLALTLQNGEILVLGGIDGQVCTATSEIFHWLYGWRATELPMSQARYLHAGAVLPNGDVFVTGGWTGSVTTSSAVYIP